MVIGFTGTHVGQTDEQKKTVRQLLMREVYRDNTDILEFHEGDCMGADEQAADIAWELGYDIHSHPPKNPKYRFYWVPPTIPQRVGQKVVTYPEKDYLVRDKDIVNPAQRMIATPAGTEELRSGTWATIRYTRKKKIPLSIVWPDGTVSYENFDTGSGQGS